MGGRHVTRPRARIEPTRTVDQLLAEIQPVEILLDELTGQPAGGKAKRVKRG